MGNEGNQTVGKQRVEKKKVLLRKSWCTAIGDRLRKGGEKKSFTKKGERGEKGGQKGGQFVNKREGELNMWGQ